VAISHHCHRFHSLPAGRTAARPGSAGVRQCEGVVGVCRYSWAATRHRTAPWCRRASAITLKAHLLMEEFDRAGAVITLAAATQARLRKCLNPAVCNRHSPVGQQLCRWLLPRSWTACRTASHDAENSSPICWACAMADVTEAAGRYWARSDQLARDHISDNWTG
jgi:hypothetical protein